MKPERGKIGLSHIGERRSEAKPPFDVNLKPRHKHVSRVAAPVGAEGRKRGREGGACDAESDFGS